MDLLNRILSGVLRFRVNGKLTILESPTSAILYEADEYYLEHLSTFNGGILTEYDAYDILISTGKWTKSKEIAINEELPKIIEDTVVEMYINRLDTERVEQLRRKLNRAKNELFRLLTERHSLDEYTDVGLANMAKKYFIIGKTAYFLDKTDHIPYVKEIADKISTYQISDTDYRSIARSAEWSIKWAMIKKNCFTIEKHSTELENLIRWSILYDNVYESGEPPTEDVINDDDLFDGYRIYKNRERERELKKQNFESEINKKGGNGNGEVFVLANNKQHAKNIMEMNDSSVKDRLKMRLDQLKECGTLKEGDLKDVQMNLMMEINKMRSSNGK